MLLAKRLGMLFEHDSYADSHGVYRVSSLYFDTPYDKALKEKADGIRKREKFRIRYYNDSRDFVRLEKKMKYNGLSAKNSAGLSRLEVEKILDGNVEFLFDSKDALKVEFYSKIKGQQLKPKKIVEYEREAFIYTPGNVRITLDRNLTTSSDVYRFMDSFHNRMNISDKITVLEVKYDEFLPDIVKMVMQGLGRNNTAYSKYGMARRFE